MEYKWENSYYWLADRAKDWSKSDLYSALRSLASQSDPEILQDIFQNEMSLDGYFDKTKED